MTTVIKEEVVWLEPQESCDVSVRLIPHSVHDVGASSEKEDVCILVVHASFELLSKIPYFASSLSEPWQAGKEKQALREINLECAAAIHPVDYCRCLHFLKPDDMDLTWTVDTILKVLRVADYMDYRDCAEICMKYLASIRWSDAEEVAIRDTFSAMGIKPSGDLCARLEPIQDARELFKEVLLLYAQEVDIHIDAQFTRLDGFVRAAVSNARPKVAHMSRIALMEAWVTTTEGIINGEANKMQLWGALTKVNLLHGDEVAVLNALMERCEKFSRSVHRAIYFATSFFFDCLSELLARVVSCREGVKPSVLLSNDKRALLVAAFMPMTDRSHQVKDAIGKIVSTLPLQHPVLRKRLREVFLSDEPFWRSKLFLVMDRSEGVAVPKHDADSKHTAD